jgi:hypothetical protein
VYVLGSSVRTLINSFSEYRSTSRRVLASQTLSWVRGLRDVHTGGAGAIISLPTALAPWHRRQSTVSPLVCRATSTTKPGAHRVEHIARGAQTSFARKSRPLNLYPAPRLTAARYRDDSMHAWPARPTTSASRSHECTAGHARPFLREGPRAGTIVVALYKCCYLYTHNFAPSIHLHSSPCT